MLGSLNLSEFIINGEFDYDEFTKAVSIAVRGLNKVLDEGLPKHPLQEQRDSVRDWRQIGLGIFGLADALIKMGIKYGDDSIEFINTIGEYLINAALLESANLSKKFGPYPKYNNLVLKSDFFKYVTKNHPEVVEAVNKYGLRNSQLLTCAPTGSLASLLNTSGSAEAIFATSYNRRTLSLKDKETVYKVYPKIIKEFIDKGYSEDNLPDYIVTAHMIPYRERLNVQAALNTWIDASISSTCNVPESIAIKEVADLYLYAWEVGCKGVTIWRDNCKRAAILTTSSESKPIEPSIKFNSISPVSRKKIGTTMGATHCKKCACGTLYITTNLDKDGNLVEVFSHTSKGGICQANLNAVTRMISLNLRSGVRIDEIEDQLKGIHCPACQMVKAKGGTVDGLSCPDIMSRTIKEFTTSGWSICQKYDEDEHPVKHEGPVCPECGEPVIATSGCVQCNSCGWSKCG